MNFLVLATDYDGTLATHGRVGESTVAALERLRETGRQIILVTGRQLDELLEICPRVDLFEWVVAENGALLYCPQTRESRLLAEGVPAGFVEELRARGVERLGVGRSVVATWRPMECSVLEVLRDMGLDRQIIFNKDAVMVLPTGVNKGFGLTAALEEMKVSHHNVVAVGDAENDLPMLTQCECGAAVENALEAVKQKADVVLRADHGAGVEELIAGLMEDDLSAQMAAVERRGLLLGWRGAEPERSVRLPGMGQSLLVAGPSGSGKSTAILGLLERMAKSAYQFCIFDPEGDYEGFEPAVTLGNPHYVPTPEEVMRLLERMHSAVVNMLGVGPEQRPAVAGELLRKCMDLRGAKGRPHWFVMDESHHIFPSDAEAGNVEATMPPKTSLLITVHPGKVRREALETIDIVMAVGKGPGETIAEFCRAVGAEPPEMEARDLEHGEVMVWFRRGNEAPFVVKAEAGKTEHKRHIRKYAEGDLGVGSFVFRGPEGRLNLVAQNVNTFLRMGEGVDDETWMHHLREGHFSEWFRWIVKNRELADEVRSVEQSGGSAEGTREQVLAAVRARYTLPP